jgi:hypothetical protein
VVLGGGAFLLTLAPKVFGSPRDSDVPDDWLPISGEFEQTQDQAQGES